MLKKLDEHDCFREPRSRFDDELLQPTLPPKDLLLAVLNRVKGRLQAADVAFENSKILTEREQHLFSDIFSIETDIDLLRIILENLGSSDLVGHPVQGDGGISY